MKTETKSVGQVLGALSQKKEIHSSKMGQMFKDALNNTTQETSPDRPLTIPKFPRLKPMSAKFRARLFELDETHDPSVPKLTEWGEWFFRSAVHNDRSKGHQLALVGGPGTAKTHVMQRIHQQLQAWGVDICMSDKWGGKFPTSVFVDWSDIAEADKEWSLEKFFREVAEAKIIFLDDIGAEADRYRNGVNTSRLRRVLGECEDKWLMVSTNLPKKDWPKFYDHRVADRLSLARVLDMGSAKSYRPKLSTGRKADK